MESARRARPTDLDAVVGLARAARAELEPERGGGLLVGRELRPEPLEGAFGHLLDREDACVAVGTIDDVVLGYGVAELEHLRGGDVLGVLTELYVEPAARAVGVGEEMGDLLVAFCTEARATGIDAFALPGARQTKNYFEAHGFSARLLVMHRAIEPEAGGEPSLGP